MKIKIITNARIMGIIMTNYKKQKKIYLKWGSLKRIERKLGLSRYMVQLIRVDKMSTKNNKTGKVKNNCQRKIGNIIPSMECYSRNG